MPKWSQRPSGPSVSVIERRKAVTSWRVVSKISIIRWWLYAAPRSDSMSSSGMTPASVHASHTASSTSSHMRYLFSSDQTCFIAGLE